MTQPTLFGPDVARSATISDCGRYRYDLTRTWAEGPSVAFCMVNPSTADAEDDDQTIRKCIRLARRWGYGGLVVVNLYAWRATGIADLWRSPDPVGPRNDESIFAHAEGRMVIAAWGAKPKADARIAAVCAGFAARGIPLHALRLTRDGYPEHPLFLPEALTPFAWKGGAP